VLNAIRHSGGNMISVRLAQERGSLLLEIKDNGEGIVASSGDRPGIGLAIMRHRAGLVHGHLLIDSAAGRGTRIVCHIGEAGNKESAARPE
jgi:signal transduction histidine kinase